jgi:hypothetical protein
MAMEKNGAINSETPSCGSHCGCDKQASAKSSPSILQGLRFPETTQLADALENDLTKQAADAVRAASKPAR